MKQTDEGNRDQKAAAAHYTPANQNRSYGEESCHLVPAKLCVPAREQFLLYRVLLLALL